MESADLYRHLPPFRSFVPADAGPEFGDRTLHGGSRCVAMLLVNQAILVLRHLFMVRVAELLICQLEWCFLALVPAAWRER